MANPAALLVEAQELLEENSFPTAIEILSRIGKSLNRS